MTPQQHESGRQGQGDVLDSLTIFFNREMMSIGCIAFKARCFGPALSIFAHSVKQLKPDQKKHSVNTSNQLTQLTQLLKTGSQCRGVLGVLLLTRLVDLVDLLHENAA